MGKIPDLTNEAAMIARGRLSSLGSARNEAACALRDANTLCQSADWEDLAGKARESIAAAERLILLATMWGEL